MRLRQAIACVAGATVMGLPRSGGWAQASAATVPLCLGLTVVTAMGRPRLLRVSLKLHDGRAAGGPRKGIVHR